MTVEALLLILKEHYGHIHFLDMAFKPLKLTTTYDRKMRASMCHRYIPLLHICKDLKTKCHIHEALLELSTSQDTDIVKLQFSFYAYLSVHKFRTGIRTGKTRKLCPISPSSPDLGFVDAISHEYTGSFCDPNFVDGYCNIFHQFLTEASEHEFVGCKNGCHYALLR